MRSLISGFLLFVFWFLLSGQTGVLFLSLGLGSVVIVLWLMQRMDRHDRYPAEMVFGLEFARYLAWLMWQVLRANIDVARRIWDPSMPIRPVYRKLEVSIQQPLLKTIYANSITLTPGTVTVKVGDDHFWVHALDPGGVDELQQGEMEARVKRLGAKP